MGPARLPGLIGLDIVSDLIRVFDCVDVMAKMSSRFGLTPGDRAGRKVDARRRRT